VRGNAILNQVVPAFDYDYYYYYYGDDDDYGGYDDDDDDDDSYSISPRDGFCFSLHT
jgi:hypothetical protein